MFKLLFRKKSITLKIIYIVVCFITRIAKGIIKALLLGRRRDHLTILGLFSFMFVGIYNNISEVTIFCNIVIIVYFYIKGGNHG